MEEGSGVDDIHISFELRKSFPLVAIPITKDITTEKLCLYPIPVLEKLIAEISVFKAEICTVEIRGRGACSNKRANVLPEAAAEIEKCLGVLETRNNGVKERVDGYGEVEEAELADARIRVNGPCAITLVRKRMLVHYARLRAGGLSASGCALAGLIKSRMQLLGIA